MMEYLLFDRATGIFTGASFSGPLQLVSAQLGDELMVWPADGVDALSQRVDVQAWCLVEYQPPRPDDDVWRTWVWDDAARRWTPIPTDAALAVDVRAERDRRLADCDWVVLRAAEQGNGVPAGWAAYRQALRDVTAQEGFPRSVVWPPKPWVAG